MLSEILPDTCVIAPDFFPLGLLMGNMSPPDSVCALICTFIFCCFICKLGEFKSKYAWEPLEKELFDKTTTYMINEGVERFGLLSFCWGAVVSFNACGSALHKDKITCSMNCHPSLENMAGPTPHLDIVRSVSCPQFIAATLMESAAYKPGGAVEGILKEKEFGSLCEYYLYEQAHGFAARGNMQNAKTKADMFDCYSKIGRFFEKCTPL